MQDWGPEVRCDVTNTQKCGRGFKLGGIRGWKSLRCVLEKAKFSKCQ